MCSPGPCHRRPPATRGTPSATCHEHRRRRPGWAPALASAGAFTQPRPPLRHAPPPRAPRPPLPPPTLNTAATERGVRPGRHPPRRAGRGEPRTRSRQRPPAYRGRPGRRLLPPYAHPARPHPARQRRLPWRSRRQPRHGADGSIRGRRDDTIVCLGGAVPRQGAAARACVDDAWRFQSGDGGRGGGGGGATSGRSGGQGGTHRLTDEKFCERGTATEREMRGMARRERDDRVRGSNGKSSTVGEHAPGGWAGNTTAMSEIFVAPSS